MNHIWAHRLAVDEHLGGFYFLAIMNNAANEHLCSSFSIDVFSFPLGILLGGAWPCHLEVLWKLLEKLRSGCPIDIPSCSVWGLQFVYTLGTPVIIFFMCLFHGRCEKVKYLPVGLVCISLKLVRLSIFSCACWWPLVYLYREMSVHIFCPFTN